MTALFYAAWFVVPAVAAGIVSCCLAVGRSLARRIRAMDRRMGSEAWIRAVELQAEADLHTCRAINALDPVEPRRRP